MKPVAFVALAQMDAGAPGTPAATETLTICVTVPAALAAVKVNVCVPTSVSGGSYVQYPVASSKR